MSCHPAFHRPAYDALARGKLWPEVTGFESAWTLCGLGAGQVEQTKSILRHIHFELIFLRPGDGWITLTLDARGFNTFVPSFRCPERIYLNTDLVDLNVGNIFLEEVAVSMESLSQIFLMRKNIIIANGLLLFVFTFLRPIIVIKLDRQQLFPLKLETLKKNK